MEGVCNGINGRDICCGTGTDSYYNQRVYFPVEIGDIIKEWLVFFKFSGYCFCGETVVTICEFNKLDGDILGWEFPEEIVPVGCHERRGGQV